MNDLDEDGTEGPILIGDVLPEVFRLLAIRCQARQRRHGDYPAADFISEVAANMERDQLEPAR